MRDRSPMPRCVDNPRQIPELRAHLLHMFREHGPLERAEWARIADDPNHALIEAPGAWANAAWHRNHMEDAQLVFVTPELVDIIEAGQTAVPDDLTIGITDAPWPAGFAVLGRPIYGADAKDKENQVRVDAISWGFARIPPVMTGQGEPVPSVSMVLYRLLDVGQTDEFFLRYMSYTDPLPYWCPLGRTDWPLGTRFDEQHLPFMDNQMFTSMREDRAWLVALWGVLNQRLLVETHEAPPDRAMTRRLARGGHSTAPVKVIYLASGRTRSHLVHPDAEPSGRHVKVRFPVRPHYKRQAFGPGHSERRIILVPAHMRGPEDAPLIHTERVWHVDR